MSVQGTNIEDLPPDPDPVDQPVAPEQAQAATEPEEDIVHTVKGADGSDVVPLATMLRERDRAAKKAEAKIRAEMEAKYGHIAQQVEAIKPYAEFIRQHPEIIEQAQQGTRPSRVETEQPVNDQEALELAKDEGWYTDAGQFDVARAQRALQRIQKLAQREAAKVTAPIRQQTVEGQASVMRQHIQGMRDKTGAPIATKESFDWIFNLLPAELVANKEVAFVAAMAAAGMDKFSGRIPKAIQQQIDALETYGEPIRTEAPGRRGAPAVSRELLDMGQRVGLSEKELAQQYPVTRGGGIALE